MIETAQRSLRDTHVFALPDFLSATGLSVLQRDILSTHYNKQHIYRSVLQDMGDAQHFPDPDHARNRVGFVSLGHTNRNDLHGSFEELYAHPPLLALLRAIADASRVYGADATLHLSSDREGAIYALFADEADHGSWHYDQHPFSCVVMVHKAAQGGVLEFVQMAPTQDDAYWRLLRRIWDREVAVEHYVQSIDVGQGALYCFMGNETLHQVTRVEQGQRAVIVMAFATESGFAHSDDISKLNFVDGIVQVVQPK